MHFFNITKNDCSELSGLMFTVNILFQIITPLYLMPALDKLEEADGILWVVSLTEVSSLPLFYCVQYMF